jgi:hypothetical protein
VQLAKIYLAFRLKFSYRLTIRHINLAFRPAIPTKKMLVPSR